MIVLQFSMQGEEIIEHANDRCHVFTFSVQEGNILKQHDAKCHLCTL